MARRPCVPTFRTGIDTFDGFRADPLELIDAGEDQVVAVLRVMGRAKLSGVETDLIFATLYTLREGKIARGREYATRDDALEAAGLSDRMGGQVPQRLTLRTFVASTLGARLLPGVRRSKRTSAPNIGGC
jgi:hypothetical protein